MLTLSRAHVAREWGFSPAPLCTLLISSDALSREFRTGQQVLAGGLFELDEDAGLVILRNALDAITEEGYYLLLSSGRPFWRQVVIGEAPDTLIALSHQPGVPPLVLSRENAHHVHALYRIVAGEPRLYAIPKSQPTRRGRVQPAWTASQNVALPL